MTSTTLNVGSRLPAKSSNPHIQRRRQQSTSPTVAQTGDKPVFKYNPATFCNEIQDESKTKTFNGHLGCHRGSSDDQFSARSRSPQLVKQSLALLDRRTNHCLRKKVANNKSREKVHWQTTA